MNIWIINQFALTPDSSGGTRHFDLAEGLTSLGNKVTIFAGGMNYSTFMDKVEYSGSNYASELVGGVNFVWIKTLVYRSNGLRRIINMFQFASRFREASASMPRPDVIIGSTVQPIAARAAGRLASSLGVPFVFEIRDLWPQTMIDMGAWSEKGIASRYFSSVEKETVNLAAAVISLSPLTEQYLLDLYRFESVVYIPNFLNLERVEKARQGLASKNNHRGETLENLERLRGAGKEIALFTGAVVESNSISIIYESSKLKESSNIAHVVVGSGQMVNYYSALRSENFFVLAPVPKWDVTTLLNCADVLVLAQGAVKWGSMNKLYDYLGTDIPIVSLVRYEHNVPVGKEYGVFQVKTNEVHEFSSLLAQSVEVSTEQRSAYESLRSEYLKKNHSKDIAVKKLSNLLVKVTEDVRFNVGMGVEPDVSGR